MKLKFFMFTLILLISMSFVDAGLKEKTEVAKGNIEELIPSESVSIALPLTFKVMTNEGEKFFIYVNKEGEGSFLDNADYDLVIEGKEEDLERFLDVNEEENFIKNLESISVESNSFKGHVAVETAESILGVKISKNKSFSQKLIGFFIRPLVKITGYFVK